MYSLITVLTKQINCFLHTQVEKLLRAVADGDLEMVSLSMAVEYY